MVKYLVIDTETNSLDKKNAYIIELAWVVYDDITKKIEDKYLHSSSMNQEYRKVEK